jgi:DNA-binding transcriptional ArsR family regulator
MPLRDSVADPEELATIHGALAHPTRVEILRLLRRSTSVSVSALRDGLAARGIMLDTRGVLHHLQAMHVATLVDLVRPRGRLGVVLVRDVALRTKLVESP